MKFGEMASFAKGEIWVTPRYEEYVQHRAPMDVERNTLYKILTRPKRIRTRTFSASSTGTCKRKRVFEYLGFPRSQPGPKTMNIFYNGDYTHLRYQVAGLVGGWLSDVEVGLIQAELKLSGTADAINVEGDIVEFKSINSRGFEDVSTFGPKPLHVKQVNAYMYLLGSHQAWLVYENKDTQEIKEFRVPRDEAIIREMIETLQELNKYIQSSELPEMKTECKNEKGEYKWCSYAEVCPLAKFTREYLTPGSSSSATAPSE